MNKALKLDVWSQHETAQARQRLVFLGASNLTRAFPTIVSLARTNFSNPVSIIAAHGFGRSYGLEAGIFGKKFPGIFFSGLWSALETEKSAPTAAWITDIGNDLAYEVPVEQILEWVTGCVDRLQQVGAKIVITDLPLDTLHGLNEFRFLFFRSLFFAGCRLSRREIIARATALSAALQKLGEAREIPIFSAQNEWYGLDPIHPRWAHLCNVWRELLRADESDRSLPTSTRGRWPRERRVRRMKPESWTHFSLSRRAKQPCGRFDDGSTIALY